MATLNDFMKFTKEALEDFGEYVSENSKKRLLRKNKFQTKKTTKGNLYNKIGYDLEVGANSLLVRFPFMKDVDYAKYIDQGVTGKNPSDLPKGAKWYNKQRNINRKSPFKFGSGKGKGYIKSGINQFIIKKGIKGVGEKRKGLIYIISRSIYLSGIPAKKFFTRSFDEGYKNLPDKIIEAFALDVKEKFKQFTLK